MAEKKNMKNLTTMDVKWYQSTLGLWLKNVLIFFTEYKHILLVKINEHNVLLYHFLKSRIKSDC
jgi:hypothetical protein